ncbi:MAG: FeoA family protein [Bacillota bacterium]|jgi:ferrous iron transport protein A
MDCLTKKQKTIPLSDIPVGATGVIAGLNLNGLLRRRVLDLGMVPGTFIECLRQSPSGDPTAYRVRGTTIALRRESTDQIAVYQLKMGPGTCPPVPGKKGSLDMRNVYQP